MKKLFFLIFIFSLSSLSFYGQNVKKGFKALKKFEFDRAKEIFEEVIQKDNDTTDIIRANFGLSQMHTDPNYAFKKSELAFKYINAAIDLYNKVGEKSLKALEKEDVNYNSLFKQKLFVENQLNINKPPEIKVEEKIQEAIKNLPSTAVIAAIKNDTAKKIQQAFNAAAKNQSVDELNKFIEENPNYPQLNQAIQLRNNLLFKKVKEENTVEAYQRFIDLYPNAEQANEAILARNQLAYIGMLEKSKELQFLDIEKKRKELENAKTQRLLFIAGGILLTLLVIVSLFAFIRSRKINKILESQKAALQQSNIEISIQKNLVIEHDKEIMDSINYAKKIQDAILKVHERKNKTLKEIFILFKPKDVVSGDFYWMNEQDNKLLLLAADCTGHGVPGSFMSLICTSLLNHTVIEKKITKTNLVFDEVRNGIINLLDQHGKIGEQKDGMDAALCLYDKTDNTLSFSGANNPIYIVRDINNPLVSTEGKPVVVDCKNKDFALYQLKPDKQPVGYYSGNLMPFTQQSVRLQKDDAVYMFSDGFADQFGGIAGKKFKYKQLKELFLSVQRNQIAAQKTILEEAINEWQGSLEQIDDICVIGFKV